jgi:hypothetical protein
MTVKLVVPPLEQNLTVETRPKQVADRLISLPLANVAEAARTLLDELSAQNRTKMPEDTRIKLLELFRETLTRLMPALEHQYAGHALPLPEKSRIAANYARQLQTELAYGYKIILLDHASRKLGFVTGKYMPLATQRAIATLGQLLVVCYQTYAPTPAGIWAEMHTLFMYAVEEGIQDTNVESLGQQSSVNLAYKQALLLALLDPYRLMQGEVNKALEYLSSFGGHAHLQPLMQTSNPSGFFLARLDSDKPPRALAHDTTVTDARTDILLNTLDLARLLHQQIKQMESGVDPKTLHLPVATNDFGYSNLLRRMLKHWGLSPKRMFNRQPNSAHMDICSGISAIHHFLGKDPGGSGSDEGVTEIVEELQTEITLELANSPLDKTSQQTYVSHNWMIINESAGGVALTKDPGSSAQIRVGEIVGLKPKESESWNVGVVRWVSSKNPMHLQLGAQMLAPTAEAVFVRSVIGHVGDQFQRALLLPEIPALKQAATLVCQRGCFAPKREFILERGSAQTAVRASKLLEQTATFELFEFVAS